MKLNPAALAFVAGNLSQSVYMHIVHTKLLCINQKQKQKKNVWIPLRRLDESAQCFPLLWKQDMKTSSPVYHLRCTLPFCFCYLYCCVVAHGGCTVQSCMCVCFLWRNVLVKDLNETSTPDAAPPGSCVDFNPVPSRLSNESKKKKKFGKGHPELNTNYSIRAHFRVSIEFCSFTWMRKDFYSLPVY